MNKLTELLLDIETYNAELYNSYKPTEKIDFSLSKKNWGKDVIPKEFWIDISKRYITRSGLNVENLHITMENSNGNEVTFPIKGTLVIKREGKKDKRSYEIWTLDGRKDTNIINGSLDLVEAR